MVADVNQFNLNFPDLVEGTLYDVVVHAENAVGRSPPSNVIMYQRERTILCEFLVGAGWWVRGFDD